MTTEFSIREIKAGTQGKYVHLAIETQDGQRFLSFMSEREHAALLGALIRAGLDVETSALRTIECEQPFRAALAALEGSDSSPSGQVN